jgi:hypothetical protein
MSRFIPRLTWFEIVLGAILVLCLLLLCSLVNSEGAETSSADEKFWDQVRNEKMTRLHLENLVIDGQLRMLQIRELQEEYTKKHNEFCDLGYKVMTELFEEEEQEEIRMRRMDLRFRNGEIKRELDCLESELENNLGEISKVIEEYGVEAFPFSLIRKADGIGVGK